MASPGPTRYWAARAKWTRASIERTIPGQIHLGERAIKRQNHAGDQIIESSDQQRNQSSPLVSVVIPTYNNARYVRAAIESVLAQTFTDIEVIVIDDGSEDNTEDELRPVRDRIRCIRQENQGAAAARNRGIAEANGEFIAFLDSDDLWLPEKLAGQMDTLAQHPDFPVAHTDSLVIDADAHILKPSANRKRQSRNGMVFEELFMSSISVILTSTVVIHHRCFEEIGVFDPAFPVFQDYDFFLRLSFRYPVYFIDKPLVKYRLTPRSLTRTNLRRNIAEQAAILRKCITSHGDYFREHPRVAPRKGRRFHTEAGLNLFFHDDREQARKHLARVALRSPNTFCYYLATFLPSSFVSYLRSLKRR